MSAHGGRPPATARTSGCFAEDPSSTAICTCRSPNVAETEPSRTWPVTTVLAVVTLVVSVLVAGGLLLILGSVDPLLVIAASFGGFAAATAGASAHHLITSWQRSVRNHAHH